MVTHKLVLTRPFQNKMEFHSVGEELQKTLPPNDVRFCHVISNSPESEECASWFFFFFWQCNLINYKSNTITYKVSV